jgi:DNA repair exonuclease SbcCD nuclease subunit
MSDGILVVADLHLDIGRHETTGPDGINKAWSVAHRAWLAACDEAIERQVKMVAVAGDAFHAARPLPEPSQMLLDGLLRLTQAKIPVALIGGNHELWRWPWGHRHVLQQYSAIDGVEVVLHQPRVLRLADGTQVACLPWPHVTNILADVDEVPPDPGSIDQLVTQWLHEQIDQLSEQVSRSSDPSVLVGHAMLDTARAGSELSIAPMAMSRVLATPMVSTHQIAQGPWSPAIFGHVHQRQQLGPEVWYGGTPWTIDFENQPVAKGSNLIIAGQSEPQLLEGPDRSLFHLRLHRPQDIQQLDDLPPDTLVRITADSPKLIERTQDKVVEVLRARSLRLHDWQLAEQEPEQQQSNPDQTIIGSSLPPIEAISQWCEMRQLDPDLAERMQQEARRILAEMAG